ncbi:sulfatase family protein [Sciscionella sediminilitoris]|uniref:sulfatase family protein n=1 Tax=Sciscionella sediminilitoris TaxID=1445613 RepID=UPI00068B1DFF|nr:sulfatase-like hydrolase/transferase [Sciscionella sp. SE31]
MTGQPNIVVIMADQQRADLCAREGFPLDTTPFTDELAGEGTWFDRAHTTSPLCCPARTSLLTGRYPSAHRVRENPAAHEAVFAADLPGLLRDSGYATGLSGKNHSYLRAADLDHFADYSHVGAVDPGTAREREFDEWLLHLRHRTHPEPTPFPLELQCPHRIVSDAQRWLDSLSGQPFFLWLSFPEPHNPYQVPEPYFSMFPPEQLPPVRYGPEALREQPFAWRYLRTLGETGDPGYAASIDRARANYCGMLRLIDDQIRRFVTFLDQRGLRADTLLFITSDHGDYVGEYGLLRKGAELPELLTRVPFVVNGPGVATQRGPHPAHVSLADVFPTVCEAIGEPIPDGVQGRSLWPMLRGADYPAAEFASAYVEQGIGGLPYEAEDVPEPLPGLGGADGWSTFDELNAVTQSGSRRAIRCGDWKLVVDGAGSCRLHHLPEDPGELRDVSAEHPGMLTELLRELVLWMLRTEDPLPLPHNGYRRKRDPRNYLAPYRVDRS